MNTLTSISNSLPYLIYFFVLVYLLFNEFKNINKEKDSLKIYNLSIIVFIIFFGLRGFVMSDWVSYYNLFEDIPTLWDTDVYTINKEFVDEYSTDVVSGNTGVELGFVYFTMLIKSIAPNYHVWVLINSIIDVLMLSLIFKRYSKYYVLSFILFFIFGGIVLEINLMRNIKAILLFLLSIKYIEERKMFPFFALNIIGYFFHSSALFFFPMYFFIHKEISRNFLWIIFILGNVLFLFQINYISPILIYISQFLGDRLGFLINVYVDSGGYSKAYGISIGYFERVVTFILIMFYRQKLIEDSKSNIIFLNLYVLYFISYFYFYEIFVVVERISLLFIVSYWIIYPAIFSLVSNMKIKLLFIGIIIFYGILKTALSFSNILAKYDNVIFGIESYDDRFQKYMDNIDDLIEKR